MDCSIKAKILYNACDRGENLLAEGDFRPLKGRDRLQDIGIAGRNLHNRRV
jgi:hypothetical protein